MSDAPAQSKPPRELGTITDYDSMLTVLRTRATERQIAVGGEDVAEVAGLATGYLQKILCNPPVKRIGAVSLGPILSLLGVKLIAVEDADALRRYGSRLRKRKECWVRGALGSHVTLTRRHLQRIGKLGGARRAKNLTPAARSEHARKAAAARWSKVGKRERRAKGRALAALRWKPRKRRRR